MSGGKKLKIMFLKFQSHIIIIQQKTEPSYYINYFLIEF